MLDDAVEVVLDVRGSGRENHQRGTVPDHCRALVLNKLGERISLVQVVQKGRGFHRVLHEYLVST